jgi:hypothetical protein
MARAGADSGQGATIPACSWCCPGLSRAARAALRSKARGRSLEGRPRSSAEIAAETVSCKKIGRRETGALERFPDRVSNRVVVKRQPTLRANPPLDPDTPDIDRPDRRRGDHGAPESLRALDAATYAAGRELRNYVDEKHLDHFSLGWVGAVLERDGSAMFDFSCKTYDELTTLAPGTPKYEKAMALDVWVSISILLMMDAPHWHTMVPLTLYKYMRACGAPLPDDYESATTARKRMMRALQRAIDPAGNMSKGWRRNWRGRYPLTATALSFSHPLPKRRDRVDFRT